MNRMTNCLKENESYSYHNIIVPLFQFFGLSFSNKDILSLIIEVGFNNRGKKENFRIHQSMLIRLFAGKFFIKNHS